MQYNQICENLTSNSISTYEKKDRDRRRTRTVRYEGHLGDNLLMVEGGPVSADSPCSCPGHVLWVSLELTRSDLSPQKATSP
ncbi:hypothetical protein J6590_053498 [Homalodisca vitripennis]|nr:hypothetical protein J6590_053498 [Homalodisca vitripennis]